LFWARSTAIAEKATPEAFRKAGIPVYWCNSLGLHVSVLEV
jgi:hypothetical protein